MPPLPPISRQKLIRNLRSLGFEGPYSGGSHQYMVKDQKRLYIPNPHSGDISGPFLANILKQADIDLDEWLML